jgi:hypothetical protein
MLNALGGLRADDPAPSDLDALLDAYRAHVG